MLALFKCNAIAAGASPCGPAFNLSIQLVTVVPFQILAHAQHSRTNTAVLGAFKCSANTAGTPLPASRLAASIAAGPSVPVIGMLTGTDASCLLLIRNPLYADIVVGILFPPFPFLNNTQRRQSYWENDLPIKGIRQYAWPTKHVCTSLHARNVPHDLLPMLSFLLWSGSREMRGVKEHGAIGGNLKSPSSPLPPHPTNPNASANHLPRNRGIHSTGSITT